MLQAQFFFEVAFWWLLKSFKMVTRLKKLVATKKKPLGVILHLGLYHWPHWLLVLHVLPKAFPCTWPLDIGCQIGDFLCKLSRQYVYCFTRNGMQNGRSLERCFCNFPCYCCSFTHLHLVCHPFICLMSLFQGHVACCNFTVKGRHE